MNTPSYDLILDFDDVIYPFCQGVMAVLAAEGIPGEITQWELENDFGIPKDEFWEMIYQPKYNELLFLQPINFELVNQLRRLRYAGHRLHIVTARTNPTSEHFCRVSLNQNSVPVDTLTFTKNKGPMVDELNASFSLDDGPHNYEVFEQFNHVNYLMDARHNQGFDTTSTGETVRRLATMSNFTNSVIAFQEADVQLRGTRA